MITIKAQVKKVTIIIAFGYIVFKQLHFVLLFIFASCSCCNLYSAAFSSI
ncbi:hypothetical protein RAMDARK_1470 [Rickettsia amblyommatis str. Darkwater]|uniref:Uncharacterized protein n=1 Tax=Rickettsia amblyommatis str. Ac/Pa TaxID=1359164 RepID=A0A0F3MZW8_RICAM|nr:hypothetical protein APHACPA_0026 [Rickettsia amblyommatis str. Ac/Pa]KJV88918.1 hypothetical protein RAMDARK_1470 [Rickettsia amblyommatis str. Darkwater]